MFCMLLYPGKYHGKLEYSIRYKQNLDETADKIVLYSEHDVTGASLT